MSTNFDIVKKIFIFSKNNKNSVHIIKSLINSFPQLLNNFDYEFNFCFACMNNDIELIKFYSQCHKEIDYHHCNDFAFRIACYKGNLEVVKYLYETFSYIDVLNNDVLIMSIKNHHDDIAYYLLKNLHVCDDKFYNDCIISICDAYSSEKLFKIIFSKISYFDNNEYSNKILDLIFSEFSDHELLDQVYEKIPKKYIHDDNEYIFRKLCSYGNIDKINTLLQYYPDIDIHVLNDEAFRVACAHNQLSIAKFLKDNFPDIYIDINDNFYKKIKNRQIKSWLKNIKPGVHNKIKAAES